MDGSNEYGSDSAWRYSLGILKYAQVNNQGTYYFGWVLCFADGRPMTYADANKPGSITVSASGSYVFA